MYIELDSCLETMANVLWGCGLLCVTVGHCCVCAEKLHSSQMNYSCEQSKSQSAA